MVVARWGGVLGIAEGGVRGDVNKTNLENAGICQKYGEEKEEQV